MQELVQRFAPNDLMTEVAWLFASPMMDASFEEGDAKKARSKAVSRVYDELGAQGVLQLAEKTNLNFLVIEAVAESELPADAVQALAESSLERFGPLGLTGGFASILRKMIGESRCLAWLERIAVSRDAGPAVVRSLT